MTEQPYWFKRLQQELGFVRIAHLGAVIDLDATRDRFLIAVLQRLETRRRAWGGRDLKSADRLGRHRGLLEQRLAGGAAAELSDTINNAAAWASCTARLERAAWNAERKAQVADLKAAIAASIQPPSAEQPLPDEVEVILPGPGIWSVCSDPSGVVLTQQPAL